MATPAQIAANQGNAKKSTGPRTDAGKTAVRQNAGKHGLCAAIPTTCLEKDEAVQQLLADLTAEHQPQGPTEEILVYKMAEQFLLARRASHYLAVNTDFAGDADSARQVALFLRYYTSADRAFTRNLHELRKLQQERRKQEAETNQAAPIGFVSQNVQPAPIPAAAAAQTPPEIVPATPAEHPAASPECSEERKRAA